MSLLSFSLSSDSLLSPLTTDTSSTMKINLDRLSKEMSNLEWVIEKMLKQDMIPTMALEEKLSQLADTVEDIPHEHADLKIMWMAKLRAWMKKYSSVTMFEAIEYSITMSRDSRRNSTVTQESWHNPTGEIEKVDQDTSLPDVKLSTLTLDATWTNTSILTMTSYSSSNEVPSFVQTIKQSLKATELKIILLLRMSTPSMAPLVRHLAEFVTLISRFPESEAKERLRWNSKITDLLSLYRMAAEAVNRGKVADGPNRPPPEQNLNQLQTELQKLESAILILFMMNSSTEVLDLKISQLIRKTAEIPKDQEDLINDWQAKMAVIMGKFSQLTTTEEGNAKKLDSGNHSSPSTTNFNDKPSSIEELDLAAGPGPMNSTTVDGHDATAGSSVSATIPDILPSIFFRDSIFREQLIKEMEIIEAIIKDLIKEEKITEAEQQIAELIKMVHNVGPLTETIGNEWSEKVANLIFMTNLAPQSSAPEVTTNEPSILMKLHNLETSIFQKLCQSPSLPPSELHAKIDILESLTHCLPPGDHLVGEWTKKVIFFRDQVNSMAAAPKLKELRVILAGAITCVGAGRVQTSDDLKLATTLRDLLSMVVKCRKILHVFDNSKEKTLTAQVTSFAVEKMPKQLQSAYRRKCEKQTLTTLAFFLSGQLMTMAASEQSRQQQQQPPMFSNGIKVTDTFCSYCNTAGHQREQCLKEQMLVCFDCAESGHTSRLCPKEEFTSAEEFLRRLYESM